MIRSIVSRSSFPLFAATLVVAFTDVAHAEDPAPRLDFAVGYPLVIGDGSSETDYSGLVRLGSRLMLGGGRKISWGIGMNHFVLENRVDGSRADDRDGNAVASARATTFDIYIAGAWIRGQSLWTIYAALGMAWRTFEHVRGTGFGGYFAVGGAWSLYVDSRKKYFIGPAVELSVLTESRNSSIGSVSFLSGEGRFGFSL